MRLVVVSHKECWRSPETSVGYATDGGFAMQMGAIASLFDDTHICVPIIDDRRPVGEVAFKVPGSHSDLRIVPLPSPRGSGVVRKVRYLGWLMRAGWTIDREIARADAVHVPIPGDVGTAGMLLAKLHRRPLFVRHCGNWHNQRTLAERFWRWFMEWRAPTGDVMVATGAELAPASVRRPQIEWLFSSSLRRDELATLAPPATAPTPDHLVLAIACRQVEAKGGGVAISALPAIRARFPGVELHVVGDGPELPRYRALAESLDVGDAVRFHGKVDHDGVLDVLQRAHVFVYPTWASEGFPKAVLEAMACGLAVVSTPVSAIPLLLDDGAGVVVDRAEPELVAKAVIDIATDPDRFWRMSETARERAIAYTLEAWGERIEGLLAGWGPLHEPVSERRGG